MKKLISYIILLTFVLTSVLCSGTALAAGTKRIAIALEGETIDISGKIGKVSSNQLVWTVDDPAVVSAEGTKIAAKAAGTSTVTVSYKTASIRMGIVVFPEQVTVPVGSTYQLPYGTVEKFAVQNKRIARVSTKGMIYGVAAGTTKLRVKYGSQVRYLTVTVTGTENEKTDSNTKNSKAAQLDCAATAEQIVLVEYEGGSKATVSIHEKKNGTWTELGSCSAYVGKNGIGKTKAGDKKTPVGTYNLTIPFGIKTDPGSKQTYTQVTKYHYWCGKSSSPYYNQLVDTRITGTKVSSSDEYLINYKGVYNYCMFIDYNAAGVAGKGSCIFLHCKGKNKYTAGCIAVDESFMIKIIKWADAGCKIVIK